jgi:hypothetical protein
MTRSRSLLALAVSREGSDSQSRRRNFGAIPQWNSIDVTRRSHQLAPFVRQKPRLLSEIAIYRQLVGLDMNVD